MHHKYNRTGRTGNNHVFIDFVFLFFACFIISEIFKQVTKTDGPFLGRSTTTPRMWPPNPAHSPGPQHRDTQTPSPVVFYSNLFLLVHASIFYIMLPDVSVSGDLFSHLLFPIPPFFFLGGTFFRMAFGIEERLIKLRGVRHVIHYILSVPNRGIIWIPLICWIFQSSTTSSVL